MKLFIDIVMKRIYLFNIVAWNYRKKIGFPVCKKENFTGLQAYRKREKSARASPTPHHTLSEEQSARFTAQPLSALRATPAFPPFPASQFSVHTSSTPTTLHPKRKHFLFKMSFLKTISPPKRTLYLSYFSCFQLKRYHCGKSESVGLTKKIEGQ